MQLEWQQKKIGVLYFKCIRKCLGLKIERKTVKRWEKDNSHVHKTVWQNGC